ncbi:DUF1934 domain-containing protein [Virgibacillus siamensis]|uniref:DUF1934 domain-containing protein n=1 Tax=Virgibacillus siamensis TaxID=480071 RepID=UPI000986DCDE|nr:DUF1934 domain-containing protein [Virgibacillus siamensis]
MNLESKSITIEMQTMIDNDGEMEYNTLNESGTYYEKGNRCILTYEETTDDGAAIKNLITINPDRVSIKRVGVVTMHQQFHTGQKTENVFQHPHGNIHMETYTDTIAFQSLTGERNGLLTIDYSVSLNGQEARTHKLEMTLKKEESE